MFHPSIAEAFPSWDTLKALLSYSKNRKLENIIVNHTGHLHQIDLACLVPLELFIIARYWPQTTVNQTYLLMSQLLISFFQRAGFANGKGDPRKVNDFINSMKDYWLRYDIKLSS